LIEQKRIRDTDQGGTGLDHYDDNSKVMIVEMQRFEREVFYIIADEETQTKLQINQAQYDHMAANAKKLEARMPGVKVMPTAAKMHRWVYKRALLGNELLQCGDAPIKGRYSCACITGELAGNKGHWFGLIKTMPFWATVSINRTAPMKQNEQKHCAAMAKIHPRRRDDRWANAWLAKHSPKAKPNPNPKRPPPERWQIRIRAQKAERRALAKPLLKGVE